MNVKFSLYNQLKSYEGKDLKADLFAGITVAVMLVPQGMAYAMLAGLPPIYGLYAGLVPLLIYPFFGSSKELSVGPVALVSILVLSGVGVYASPGSTEFIELAILTAFVAGIIQILLSLFRLGFLINFLSNPVILGFTAAAALIIGVSQLKHILGLEVGRANGFIKMIKDLWVNLGDIHWLTLIVGVVSIAFIFLIKKFNKTLPAALFAVILGTLIVYGFHLDKHGVQIVQDVPAGLPSLMLPNWTLDNILKVTPLAFVICLISFIESLAIAKTIAAKKHNYRINANQELFGLGLAKLIGSFFQAFPNTGSFTRSAINEQSGARTGFSSVFSAVIIGLTLIFFTSWFYYLPKAILAAIVIVAVTNLVQFKDIRFLYENSKSDFSVLMVTFFLTILLGIQQGVISGVLLSIIFILYKTSRPNFAVLGRLPETQMYRDIKRYSMAEEIKQVLMFRLDASLYFGNAEYFYEKLTVEISARIPELKYVILDMSSILDLDTTGLHQLRLINEELQSAGIRFLVSGVIGPVRDKLKRSGLGYEIGEDHQFMRVKDAVVWVIENQPVSKMRKHYTQQFNQK